MEQSELEWIRQHLPEKPTKGMLDWQDLFYKGELGGEYLVFHGERVRLHPTMEELMDNRTRGKRMWAAECTCTECGETFTTAGGGKSLWLANGEDGMSYTVDPVEGYEEADVFCDRVEYMEGEEVTCPYCQNRVQLIHKKNLRGGRTKRIMVEQVVRVGDYAAVVYWMIERTIAEYGSWRDGFPMYAYVLGKRGGISKFGHGSFGGIGGNVTNDRTWRICKDNRDTINCQYADWGSINNRKAGAIIWKQVPDLAGSTGEKTGLAEMAGSGRTENLVQYLRRWKEWKAIENLVKAGFIRLVAGTMGYDRQEMSQFVDTGKAKPHEILGITRQELREYGQKLRYWTTSEWRELRAVQKVQPMGLGEYISMKQFFTNIQAAVELGSLGKVRRYLEKQGMTGGDWMLLRDSRRMAQTIQGRELTQEELWPRNLQRTHEALTNQVAYLKAEKQKQLYDKGFQEVAEKFGHLEWTDGELRVMLPRSNTDLMREGNILRHCVGGYGERHIDGRDTIFFIRHYRRPERPYYTLDINMEGTPYEVQLHGYGNERHGEHKEHKHSIPARVRSFCDRWEREVLMPWAREQAKK